MKLIFKEHSICKRFVKILILALKNIYTFPSLKFKPDAIEAFLVCQPNALSNRGYHILIFSIVILRELPMHHVQLDLSYDNFYCQVPGFHVVSAKHYEPSPEALPLFGSGY